MGKVTVHRGAEFHWVGDGFPVRSIFSYNDLGKELSPFLLLDYAAPYEFSPATVRRGVGAHPHRGFETVTIAYQGELEHRDSSGAGGKIGPGDVQWMTAASGLVHEEFHSPQFTKQGGTFEMVQLWVNLPARYKDATPGYQTLLNSAIPRVQLPDGAGEVRVIAGAYGEVRGPAKTFTPIHLWDIQINAGKTAEFSLSRGYSKAILVLRGNIEVESSRATDGDLIVLASDSTRAELRASLATKVLVLSGEPLNEPIVGYGPFVMNTEAEIKKAFSDYQMGKMGSLD